MCVCVCSSVQVVCVREGGGVADIVWSRPLKSVPLVKARSISIAGEMGWDSGPLKEKQYSLKASLSTSYMLALYY